MSPKVRAEELAATDGLTLPHHRARKPFARSALWNRLRRAACSLTRDFQSDAVTYEARATECSPVSDEVSTHAGVPQSGGAMKTKRKSNRGDGANENCRHLKNGSGTLQRQDRRGAWKWPRFGGDVASRCVWRMFSRRTLRGGGGAKSAGRRSPSGKGRGDRKSTRLN